MSEPLVQTGDAIRVKTLEQMFAESPEDRYYYNDAVETGDWTDLEALEFARDYGGETFVVEDAPEGLPWFSVREIPEHDLSINTLAAVRVLR